MDDTARLASELQDKLAELDGKVAAYQRDMLTQFRRHMDDCLKNYPPHVSDEVSRVVAASMSKYPALNPARRNTADLLTRSDDDHDDAGPKAWDGRKSPPPILYHTSGTPKEGPRSPHQREKEFQGLFTPSYLPLLDSSFRTPQSPPISLPATAPTFALVPQLVMGTSRIATIHRRLAGYYAQHWPLRVLKPPMEFPPLKEVMQWHTYREADPGLRWLRSIFKSAMLTSSK